MMPLHHQVARSSDLANKIMKILVLGGIFWFMLALFDALFDLDSTPRSKQSCVFYTFVGASIFAGVIIALGLTTLDPFHILVGGWAIYGIVGIFFITPDL